MPGVHTRRSARARGRADARTTSGGSRAHRPGYRLRAAVGLALCCLAGGLEGPQDTASRISEPETEPLAFGGPVAAVAAPLPTVGAPVAVLLEDADPTLAELLDRLLATARSEPRSGELRGRLAMAYEANGFGEVALTTYAQAAALDPSEFDWPYLRALLLREIGDHEVALDSLDASIAIDDGYMPAWLHRGAWMLVQGEYGQAAAAHTRAIELGGGVAAKVGLARTRLHEGRHDEVVALLELTVAETPHPYVHRLLGRAYQSLGRFQEARISLGRGARGLQHQRLLWPDPKRERTDLYISGFNGRLTRAEVLLSIGARREALNILESLNEDRPDHPAVLAALALAYAQVGRVERARAILQHGIDLHPDYYYFHIYIADVHYGLGDTKLALSHIHRAMALIPERGDSYARAGRLLLKLGSPDEALDALDQALDYGVQDPEHVLHLSGRVEMRRERWREAADDFRRAVSIDETFTPAQIELARCLGELGHFQQAETILAWAATLGDRPAELRAARDRLAKLQSTTRSM